MELIRGEVPKDLGYGSGSGSGSGYGSGSGSGSGYGSGYGSGDGSGSGSGSGDGSGSGYGSGYGSGDGSGSGYGDGYGDGYWQIVLAPHARANATLAFWKSNKDGKPSNGGSGTVAAVGLVEELPGPLPVQCGRGAFHATLDPSKWDGDRLWIVALHGEVRTGSDKLWALKREFIAEVPW